MCERERCQERFYLGTGFGLKREDMLALAAGDKPLLRDVQSLTDWLWYINTKALAEAAAATSFAIEGIAGDIARKVTAGFEHYKDEPGVDLSSKTYRWMREHAHYDDEHPKVALEIVEQYANTPQLKRRVMFAAKRSLQLLDQALITSVRAYSPANTRGNGVAGDARKGERRYRQEPIDFPDRRFRERRGLAFDLAA